MSLQLEIVDDPARAASAMLLSAMLGGGDVVLTGGNTPRPAYEELARAVRTVGHDLRNTTVWFSDERCVAPDHEQSNFKMANDALLSKIDAAAVHRIQGELSTDPVDDRWEGRPLPHVAGVEHARCLGVAVVEAEIEVVDRVLPVVAAVDEEDRR